MKYVKQEYGRKSHHILLIGHFARVTDTSRRPLKCRRCLPWPYVRNLGAIAHRLDSLRWNLLSALFAGSLADWIGRRSTIISGCDIFSLGVIFQVASTTVPVLVVGRLIADIGIGIGFISAVIILYMSEVAPKGVRGAIVSGYQFCITWVFALILGIGLFFLPESPRWYVKCNRLEDAACALSTLRGQPADSQYVKDELAELVANYQMEHNVQASWVDCFTGEWKPSSNLRRVVLGMTLQMMQQWTGVNFIFYYGSTFFKTVGIHNAFLVSMITSAVNPIEQPGRRALLIHGAIGMLVCEFIIAIVGTVNSGSKAASTCLIVFTCIYIFFFATTWGPAAWIVIGELWNFVIGFITPYLMNEEYGNLKTKVFFVWGSTCTLCVLFAYFFVPETKGLALEQVDRMLEETTPRGSRKWVPCAMYAGRDEASLGRGGKTGSLGAAQREFR
ncbi:general substrate transporter [Dothidotthia symphoricarpi CBS 119687]|uniref:General substrate transporter n=1 Tax=Dothidotthia symphoricarpi CBS 119687 TaxID=1392245 RepID=A0A6A6A0Q0_9PLEO|nr:general substrate transporter [Dothidotthia symphoricarpi CBS 119687]KAF2124278.1 general substrate transporter [Dothidotthia symphoricarpi CBS 119687]